MYHFFARKENISEDHIVIDGTDVNHIKNVLRMKKGDEILISDEDANDYSCEIEEFFEDAIRLKVRFVYEMGHELKSKIYLFQGLPKSDKMELIIQKAVELGAYQIIPVATKRSIVKLDDKKEASKLKRWQQISESAAKQSKRSIIPEITGVMNFEKAIAYAENMDVILMPYENAEGMEDTRKIIDGIKSGQSVAVFIGPEGGFDEGEVTLATDNGAKAITLGKRILRTETAGMTVLSILMYHMEE